MKSAFSTRLGRLYYGDAKDILQMIPDECIDLVVTDPPYPKEFEHTYKYLADYCPTIMKPGASLLTIVPHYNLPKVISYFSGKLKYRWELNMDQFDGQHSRMAMGIEVTWKPILWYVKGSYPSGRGFIVDRITLGKPPKGKLHKWQQQDVWAEYLIRKLSNEDDVILDPYAGSGTTLLMAEKMGRRWIGIDSDKDCIGIIKKRLS